MPNIHLRNNYQKAVVCMVLAYISIALMGVFVKYASDELPSSEILFSRFFIGFVFLLPFLIKDGDFKVDMSQWKFLILRNLAGIASMLLTFYAIKYLVGLLYFARILASKLTAAIMTNEPIQKFRLGTLSQKSQSQMLEKMTPVKAKGVI